MKIEGLNGMFVLLISIGRVVRSFLNYRISSFPKLPVSSPTDINLKKIPNVNKNLQNNGERLLFLIIISKPVAPNPYRPFIGLFEPKKVLSGVEALIMQEPGIIKGK